MKRKKTTHLCCCVGLCSSQGKGSQLFACVLRHSDIAETSISKPRISTINNKNNYYNEIKTAVTVPKDSDSVAWNVVYY